MDQFYNIRKSIKKSRKGKTTKYSKTNNKKPGTRKTKVKKGKRKGKRKGKTKVKKVKRKTKDKRVSTQIINQLNKNKARVVNNKLNKLNNINQLEQNNSKLFNNINKFKGTIEEFDLPNKTNNNKKIVLIMAHSSYCSYDTIKKSYLKNPSQDVIPRTKILESYNNIKLLSTQSIGRVALSREAYDIYELLKKYDLLYDALEEISSQKQAENLNKLYKFLLKIHNDYAIKKYEKIFGERPQVEITNFRIYPKKTKFRNPVNNKLHFYPFNMEPLNKLKPLTEREKIKYNIYYKNKKKKEDQETYQKIINFEVIGIFDITKKNKYGIYEVSSIIFDNIDEIKKCFFKQLVNSLINDISFMKCSLLIPDINSIGLLETFLKSINVTLEEYYEEIKYNLYIYDYISPNFDRELQINYLYLETIIEYIQELNVENNDDILIIENTCKTFIIPKHIVKSKSKLGDILDTELHNNNDFPFKEYVKVKRSQSREDNTNNNNTNNNTNNTIVPKNNINYYINKFIEDRTGLDPEEEEELRKSLKDYNGMLKRLEKITLQAQALKTNLTTLPENKLQTRSKYIKWRRLYKTKLYRIFLVKNIIRLL